MKILSLAISVLILASCSTTPSNDTGRYRLVNAPVSWTQAKILAEQNGAHLATFSSREELQLFMSTIPDRGVYWIGLSDEDEEGVWRWVDGTPLIPEMQSNLELGGFRGVRDYAHTTLQGQLGSRADSGVLPRGFNGKPQVDGYIMEFD
jgi:hypothetical protein